MKYFYDLEFLEDGSTIAPISIGVWAQDGRRYYAVASDAPYARIRLHPWLRKNVLAHLPHRKPSNWERLNVGGQDDWMAKNFDVDMGNVQVRPTWVIANELYAFFSATAKPIELWADYGAYDHVCLMQFWGTMMKKPSFLPMFTNDIQQLLYSGELTDADWEASDICKAFLEKAQPHNALSDAEQAMVKHHWATTLLEGRAVDEGMQAWQEGQRVGMEARELAPGMPTDPSQPQPLPPGVNGALLWAMTRKYGSPVEEEMMKLIVPLGDMDRATKTQVRPSDGLDALVLIAAPPAPLQESDIDEPGKGSVAVQDKEDTDGQQRGRQEGLRVPESVRGVSGAPQEGPEQDSQRADSERGQDQGGAQPDGTQGAVDPTCTDTTHDHSTSACLGPRPSIHEAELAGGERIDTPTLPETDAKWAARNPKDDQEGISE